MKIADAMARLDDAARLAAARGSLIFHLDLATEVARAEFARRGIADDRLATLVDDRGYRVFALADAPAPRAIAEARFDRHGAAIVLPVPDAVPPRAWTLAQARRTILEQVDAAIAVVVPSSDPWQPIEGYAIATSGSADAMCVAGHARLTLDPAGRRIETRAAIGVAIDPAPRSTRSVRGISLADAGAIPVELHTYLSLKHGLALSIESRASGLVWRVDGERVSRI